MRDGEIVENFNNVLIYNALIRDIKNKVSEQELIENYKLNGLNIDQIYSLVLCSMNEIKNNNIYKKLIENLLELIKTNSDIEVHKNYAWKIIIKLFHTEEDHLSGEKLAIFKNILITALEYIPKEEINSAHVSLTLENYLYSTVLANIFFNKKNQWMLPILINFGLDINTILGYPTMAYLYTMNNQENFDFYFELLLKLGLNPNVKDSYGENTPFILYKAMSVKIIEETHCKITEDQFKLLKTYKADFNCINYQNKNILSLLVNSNASSNLTLVDFNNNLEDQDKINYRTLVNVIKHNIESISFKEKDVTGNTIVSDLQLYSFTSMSLEEKIEKLSFLLVCLKDEKAQLLEKNSDGNSFFDELLKNNILDKVVNCLNEKYTFTFSHLIKKIDQSSYEKYNCLEKSLYTWIHSSDHNLEFFANIKETKVEEILTAELYSEKDYLNFRVYVNNLSNAENSKAFLKKISTNHSKYRIKNFAQSASLLEKIDSLREKFPHFSEAIEHIENHCILQESGSKAFYIPPILLGGGPGIGKTFFSHTIAEMVDTYFHVFNMESMTQNGTLTGTAEFWGTAAPGKIFSVLTEEKNINPIFLLDELDKCLGDERYSPSAALLPLMESYTAKKFTDECIQLPIDASKIIWIATGNELSKIGGPLKSRFDIFNIPAPNFSERKKMLNGVYQSILKNNSWGKNLAINLPETILDMLADMNSPGAIRDMRRIMTTACSRAIKNKRLEIIEQDIGKLEKPVKMLWDLPFSSE